MTNANKNSSNEQFGALRASYGAALPTKLRQIDTLFRQTIGSGHGDAFRESLSDLCRAAHKIAGSAGTFGFVEVSEAARALEDIASQILHRDQPPSDAQLAKLQNLLTKMNEATPSSRHDQAPSKAETDDLRGITRRSVLVIEDGHGVTAPLADGLMGLGCDAQLTSRPDDVLGQIGRVQPKAVVVSTNITRWPDLLSKVSEKLKANSNEIVPLICIAASDNFDDRLNALRAGANGFLSEPASPDETLRLIEDISRRATFEPHRVLVVTDDEIVASQCAAALKGPGYKTEICKDPKRVLSVVEAFNPQLVVSDLCLSLCSGLEFAMIVWQSDFGKDLEIVLLSPGPEFNDAVSRLGLPVGGFVTRPLDSSKLRACVADRLVRLKSGRDTSSRHQFISVLSRRENLKSLHDLLGVSHKYGPRPGSSHSIAPPVRPKILVVDDDPHIATAIKVKLEPFGLEILEAFNGIQGFKAACREQPDVIISDYEMPRGSADYLMTRLKQTPKTQDIPVLILTGRKFDSGKDYALEREMLGRHGAISYLSKPIDWDALVTELGRHISI